MNNFEFLFRILIKKPWIKTIGLVIIVLFGWLTISFFVSRPLINQGISYSDKGDYDTAIIYFNFTTWLNPYNPYNVYAYYNRGLAYHEQKKFNLALSDYDKTIYIDPKFSNAYVGRCIIYNLQEKYGLAITDCSKAIELDTSDLVTAYFNRGYSYLSQEEYDLAISDFSKANGIFETAKSNCMMGITYAKMDAFSKAIFFFEKGIEIDNSGELSWCKSALENARQGIPTP